MRVVQGDTFQNGFMSTFFSTIAGGIRVGSKWLQGIFQAVVGGTASMLGGGKFANGAVSAAMIFLFNDAMAADYAAKKINDSYATIRVRVQKDASYRQIADYRKKIDALFSNGAEVVMVVNGVGDVFYIVKSAVYAHRAKYFFNGAQLSARAAMKMTRGDFHNFPNIVESFAKEGKYFRIRGNDGKMYEHLHIEGGYVSQSGNIYEGTFEFIKNSNGEITHRLFRPQ
jgi:hypothetical protein